MDVTPVLETQVETVMKNDMERETIIFRLGRHVTKR